MYCTLEYINYCAIDYRWYSEDLADQVIIILLTNLFINPPKGSQENGGHAPLPPGPPPHGPPMGALYLITV